MIATNIPADEMSKMLRADRAAIEDCPLAKAIDAALLALDRAIDAHKD